MPTANEIAIISFADDRFAAFREVSWPRQHAYAMRHGYAWRGYTVRKTNRPASWNKILLIDEAIREFTVVWWMDADAAPANPDVPLPDISADLAMAQDENGYNCGVIACRANEKVKAFLHAVWLQEDCVNHRWWEQAAMHRVLEERTVSVQKLPKRFNAYPGEPDPVIVHCPAMSVAARLAHLGALPRATALPLPRCPCEGIGRPSTVAMDDAHVMLIYGLVLAYKPNRILELGIGTAKCSRAILEAIAYNTRGRLTCVDNWRDWGGRRPPVADALERCGVEIIESDQMAFLAGSHATYDFIVSDADHFSGEAALIMAALNDGGIAVFHDTNAPFDFPALQRILEHSGSYPRYHFLRNSRPDERCDRGLLVVVKHEETERWKH